MKRIKISIAFMLAVLLAAAPMAYAAGLDNSDPPAESSTPIETEPEDTTPQESVEPIEPTSAPTEPEPTAPKVIPVNYSALTLQIAAANGLNKGDYTAESWASLEEALENAKSALYSGSQYTVNLAAGALQEAIEALVEMDYDALREILEEMQAFREEHKALYDLWFDVADVVPKAEELIGGGDQAAVDAAAAQLSGLLEQMREEIDGLTYPVTVIQEVPVEVPPTDSFCNIGWHTVCLVLLFVSLALNIGLAAAVVILNRRRENRTDNTPLIDYDINDDIDSVDETPER